MGQGKEEIFRALALVFIPTVGPVQLADHSVSAYRVPSPHTAEYSAGTPDMLVEQRPADFTPNTFSALSVSSLSILGYSFSGLYL